MTFNAQETSLESGQIFELYEFNLGSDFWRFTDNQADIFFASLQWTATQIARTRLEGSTEDAVRQLKITVPLDNPVVQNYIANVPGNETTVKLYRAHANDGTEELLLVFEGKIATVNFDGELEATIVANPNTNVFNRSGPRMTYQGLCNHVLYDDRCKVNRLANGYTGLVSAVTGAVVTVNGVSAQGVDWAVGGYIVFPPGIEDDKRLVIAQSGDNLTLLIPFADTVLGQNVEVFAGCDHSLATCQAKFANAINFGGYPFVPTKNPFNSDLRGGS